MILCRSSLRLNSRWVVITVGRLGKPFASDWIVDMGCGNQADNAAIDIRLAQGVISISAPQLGGAVGGVFANEIRQPELRVLWRTVVNGGAPTVANIIIGICLGDARILLIRKISIVLRPVSRCPLLQI